MNKTPYCLVSRSENIVACNFLIIIKLSLSKSSSSLYCYFICFVLLQFCGNRVVLLFQGNIFNWLAFFFFLFCFLIFYIWFFLFIFGDFLISFLSILSVSVFCIKLCKFFSLRILKLHASFVLIYFYLYSISTFYSKLLFIVVLVSFIL